MTQPMTAKRATARLYVATVSLVASVLELAAAMVRLFAALALRGASAVRPRPGVTRLPQRPNLRVVPASGSDLERERLVVALTNMGWPAPAVRRFVDGLGDRVGREPIEKLLKEGLANLAA